MAATVALAVAGAALGAPAPALFAGLVVGAGAALGAGWSLRPPGAVRGAAQVVLGVATGALVAPATVRGLGGALVPVVLVAAATLALSIAAGLVMARAARLDRATATFGMIAGGASGVVAIADDLGADQRLVAVMQYLRVLVILVLTPLLAEGLFPAAGTPGAGGAAGAGPGRADPAAVVAFLAVSAGAGLALARVTRLPAGALLGPLLVAAALALAGAPFAVGVPVVVQAAALAAIGLEVGLGFTPGALRDARRVLLPALGTILVLLVLTGMLGLALAAVTGRSALEGYLATTPGGLVVVLATAIATGADAAFVLAVQVLRVLVMLLVAPLLARVLARAGYSPAAPS